MTLEELLKDILGRYMDFELDLDEAVNLIMQVMENEIDDAMWDQPIIPN